jgi:hypothetical protein
LALDDTFFRDFWLVPDSYENGATLLIEMPDILEKSKLIRNLRTSTKGISLINQPGKILLSNPNLIRTLSEKGWNMGNIRENFALD